MGFEAGSAIRQLIDEKLHNAGVKMNVVMELAERITVLDAGRVLASGAPQDIQNDPRVQDAYLGGTHAEA